MAGESNVDPGPPADGEPTELTFQHFTVPVENGRPVELGRGAMGITYRAVDRNLHVPVALKVINSAVLTSDAARDRFLREARSAAALRHPNVAAVFYLGEQDGNVFYAMEFIDGETVEARIRREGAMPATLALCVVGQVASALAAAQKEGIIHRDIKPSNIMLTQAADGDVHVKVIDFGLAKNVEPDPEAATITQGGFLGTPHFASPEQLEEGLVDTRSDIYSLGVTLYYMLAGRTPFSGSMAQVMSQHLYRQPPIETLEDQPPAVIALLSAMLAKAPEDRPQTAAELRRRVDACLEELAATGAGEAPGELAAGRLLGGRFLLEARVGEVGEFARFRARDAKNDQAPVEVFVTDESIPAVPGLRDAVRQRVTLLAPLEAPGLRRVIAHGGGPREWFVALEVREGISLLNVLRTRRRLPLDEALWLLRPLAAALDALERARVAPPELAPHEITLAPAAEPATPLPAWPGLTVKIDALRVDQLIEAPADATIVQSSAAALRREMVDGTSAASALFTVAGLAYEILGGARFDARHNRWTPLAELSAPANQILRRALEEHGAFPDAARFVEALSAEADAPPAPLPPVESEPAPPALPPSPKKTGRPVLLTVALGAAAVLLLVGVVALLLRPSEKPPVAEATPTPEPSATQLVVSEPNQTPPPAATPTASAPPYESQFALARELEQNAAPEAALFAYAKLVADHPGDPTLFAAMQRVAARLETEHPKGVSDADLARLRPSLEAAARQGSLSAQALLGQALREREPASALHWLQAAARQGRTDAMVTAGLMLSNGRGVVAPDVKAAIAWFEAAAQRNDTNAMTFLADCYLRGLGVERDPKRAVALLDPAASLGNERAIGMLARLYERGEGVEKADPARAVALYKQAVGYGNLDAQANLGVLYIRGLGVERDPKEAVRLWREGAEQGNPNCMFFYAQSLADPDLGKDPAQARDWFIRAARAGSDDAVTWCEREKVEWRVAR